MLCKNCGSQTSNQAKFCPSCGSPTAARPIGVVVNSSGEIEDINKHSSQHQRQSNHNAVTRDSTLLLELESKKKSGGIAALLNLFIPGAGYIYCGNWILGIIAFFFVVIVFISTFGLAVFFLIFMLVIDGFLSADRYNKNLAKKLLKESSGSY